MLGAGVFAAVGPAAGAAGSWLLAGLVVAGMVAYANASSSAALAAVHPESGGAYAYGRRRLGPFWGFLAGWAFLAGKLASCAAMALTLGSYLAPGWPGRWPWAGWPRSPWPTTSGWPGRRPRPGSWSRWCWRRWPWRWPGCCWAARPTRPTWPGPGPGVHGVLQAAGLLFFAFAGYARVATLGEEVVDPARTIPRAVPLALGIVAGGVRGGGRRRPARRRAGGAGRGRRALADAVAAGRLAGWSRWCGRARRSRPSGCCCRSRPG